MFTLDNTIDNILQPINLATLETNLKSTVQFFYVKRNTPTAIGSGILITFANRFFVVTAAHVIDDKLNKMHIMCNGKRVINLDENIISTKLPATGRLDDKLDIAVIELHESAAQDLTGNGHYFVSFREMALMHKNQDDIFSVVGFIAAKTKAISSDVIKTSVFGYKTLCNKSFDYTRFSFSEINNLAVHFDGEIVSRINPNLHRAPNLEGISGCGLWQFGHMLNDKGLIIPTDPYENRKLVGIITEQINKYGTKALMATRIDYVLYFISQHFKLTYRKRPPLL